MEGPAGDVYRGMLPDEMFVDAEEGTVRLPDWYILDKIAERWRYTARDFMNLPEPDFTYWYQRGIVALEAEGEAWQLNHPKQS